MLLPYVIRNGKARVSTLEIRDSTIHYKGHAILAFAVYLDGQLVSAAFERFNASSDEISTEICRDCSIERNGIGVSCGDANIAVRKHGDLVYCFLTDLDWIRPLLPDVAHGQVWSFPVASYESQLEGSTAQLPGFTNEDVRSILNRGRVFPRQLGLYTIPELDDDPQGRELLEIIQEVAATDDMTICETPTSFRTIRIGIETDGVPETIVEVGNTNDGCAVRFVANPGFPLWLTSEAIRKRFARYVE
jgi:hypothetical protein